MFRKASPPRFNNSPRRLFPHMRVPLGCFRVSMTEDGGDHLLTRTHHRETGPAGVTGSVARNAPYARLLREPGVPPVQGVVWQRTA